MFSVVSFYSREMVSYKLLRFKYKNLFHTRENKKPTVIHKFEIDRVLCPPYEKFNSEHIVIKEKT